ncbi:MAG: hypothetical protein KIS72_02160 [Luteimonas sp.]|nr:hypothetical protein [Luteimonas sp.]
MAHLSAPTRRAWLFAVLSCLLMACAAAGGEGASVKPARFELQGDGPFQRFIVRYRDGSTAIATPEGASARIARTAAGAGIEPRVVPTWRRRLGVQADLFTVDRPLGRAEATALMQAFADDPDVEYIEVDRMVGFDPVQPSVPLRPRD